MSSGLAINGGRQSQDNLAHLVVRRPRQEFLHAKGLGSHAVERRQKATEHVVAAAEGPRPLQRP